MKHIKFQYKDAYSNWEWRNQEAVVESIRQLIELYGLNMGDVEYRIVSVEEC